MRKMRRAYVRLSSEGSFYHCCHLVYQHRMPFDRIRLNNSRNSDPTFMNRIRAHGADQARRVALSLYVTTGRRPTRHRRTKAIRPRHPSGLAFRFSFGPFLLNSPLIQIRQIRLPPDRHNTCTPPLVSTFTFISAPPIPTKPLPFPSSHQPPAQQRTPKNKNPHLPAKSALFRSPTNVKLNAVTAGQTLHELTQETGTVRRTWSAAWSSEWSPERRACMPKK